MTSRTGTRRNESGFTLLELLLVLVVLSLLAAVAFPRFSGALSRLSWDKQKQSVVDFLYHAERLARIKGEALVLVWDEDRHSLLLYNAWALSSTGRFIPYVPFERSRFVDTETFLGFGARVAEAMDQPLFEGAGDLMEAGNAMAGAPEPESRAPGYEWMTGLVEKLPLDPQITVFPKGFPMVFRPNGEPTPGELEIERGSDDRARLVITGLLGEESWEEL